MIWHIKIPVKISDFIKTLECERFSAKYMQCVQMQCKYMCIIHVCVQHRSELNDPLTHNF